MRRALFALSLLVACSHPEPRYTAIHPAPHPLEPRAVEDVLVYTTERPSMAYVEVGVFETDRLASRLATDTGVVDDLRARAAKLGCEGLVVTEHEGKTEARVTVRGTCIVFTGGER